jgi:hypothetical protein
LAKDKHGNDCKHRLRVRIYTLAPVKFNYVKALTFAEKLYGGMGILFDTVHQSCPVLTVAQQAKLAIIDGTCKWDQNNKEQDQLHKLVKAPAGQLCVFIVGAIKTPKGHLAGCAGHEPTTPGAVVSSKDASDFTLAHEIGHVLLGSGYSPVHSGDQKNIMFTPTGNIPKNSSPGFNASQKTQIMKSKLLSKA